MDYDSQISYCIVCKNRGYSLQNGTFCSFTNKKPDFYDDCKFYEYDIKIHEEIRQRKLEYFKNIEKEANSLKHKLLYSTETYRKTNAAKQNKSHSKEIFTDKIEISNDYKTKLFSSNALIMLILFLIFIDTYDYKGQAPIFYYLLIAFSLIGAVILFIQSRERKIKIIIDNEGIWTVKTGKIKWQNIALTLIKTKKEEVHTNYLVLCLINRSDEIEIPLNQLYISQADLENYIEYFKNLYWT